MKSSSRPAFLSPEEFAAYTGLGLATVRRRIKAGHLPTYQPGGKGSRVLIPADALAAGNPNVPGTQPGTLSPAPSDAATSAATPSTPRRCGPRPRLGQRGRSN